jgi:hypothetical protein
MLNVKARAVKLAGLLIVTGGLTACASHLAQSQDEDPRDTSPTLVVTGSRIPHRVPGGKPDSVKTISREGFEEDMRSNQMPHRQGN